MAVAAQFRPIRAFIVERQQLCRASLRGLFEETHDIEWAGESDGSGDVIRRAIELGADVVVVDDEIARRHDYFLVGELAEHALVVVMSAAGDPEMARYAMRRGARAVLAKESSSDKLYHAVRAVARGLRWMDPGLETAPPGAKLTAESSQLARRWGRLTKREKETAALAAEGLRYAEIAGRLGISEHTVKNHLRKVFEKLEINSRMQLALSYAWTRSVETPTALA